MDKEFEEIVLEAALFNFEDSMRRWMKMYQTNPSELAAEMIGGYAGHFFRASERYDELIGM